MNTTRSLLLVLSALLVVLFFGSRQPNSRSFAAIPETDAIQGPIVGDLAVPELSPPASSLSDGEGEPILDREINPRHNPLQFEPDQGKRGTWDRTNVPLDPLILPASGFGLTPGLDLSFDGVGNPLGCGGGTPPDPNGDVGPNHFIQMVNCTKVAIYDKAGTLLTPAFNLGSLWSSGNCTGNAGDPIVVYDPIADRWLLTQFQGPNRICAAVSTTADPTGTYHLYEFNVGSFPDYFKFGVWPDAYYMAANESTYTAYAFDRVKMLAGQAATFQKFTGGANLYLPSDLDGPTPPPNGAPNIFYTFKDNSFHGGSDRIELREFHVDWATPSNSTFTLVASLNVTPFTYTACGFFNFNCVRQLGTTQRLDAISEWPMHRFPYRNFGAHQTLLGTFVVGGGTGNVGAAVRWFELRKTTGSWTLFQEGTQDPGDGHDRFVPSIAMDKAGNIALAFSVSSNTMNPAIHYTTRLSTDPPGTMQAEAVLIAPNGSQTGSNRWGDYSAMSVDPANDCSFWYTNEYYSSNSSTSWKTRVGAFTIASCLSAATPTPTPTIPPPTATHTPTPPPATATFTPTPPPATATFTPTAPPITATFTPTSTPSPTSTPTATRTPTATPDLFIKTFLPLTMRE